MKKMLTNAVIFLLLIAAFTFTMFTAGYTAEKYGPKLRADERCINSACDLSCEQVKRFKRHQGCVE